MLEKYILSKRKKFRILRISETIQIINKNCVQRAHVSHFNTIYLFISGGWINYYSTPFGCKNKPVNREKTNRSRSVSLSGGLVGSGEEANEMHIHQRQGGNGEGVVGDPLEATAFVALQARGSSTVSALFHRGDPSFPRLMVCINPWPSTRIAG